MKTAIFRIILFLTVVTAAGCQRSCASLDRSLQAMELKRLGAVNPYPNSYKPDNAIVEPTADNLQL